MTVSLAREVLARIAPGRDTAVTIGKFDGVHRGHQYLITGLIERARAEGLAAVAVVLYPHPSTVLRPGSAVSYLTSLDERLELLRRLGPDRVGILPFTSELAQLSAPDFASLLSQELTMRLLYVGPDFALGRNREGTVGALRKIGRDLGFRVEVADMLVEEGEKVGSSAVRQALAAGEAEEMASLLEAAISKKSGWSRGSPMPTKSTELVPRSRRSRMRERNTGRGIWGRWLSSAGFATRGEWAAHIRQRKLQRSVMPIWTSLGPR